MERQREKYINFNSIDADTNVNANAIAGVDACVALPLHSGCYWQTHTRTSVVQSVDQ